MLFKLYTFSTYKLPCKFRHFNYELQGKVEKCYPGSFFTIECLNNVVTGVYFPSKQSPLYCLILMLEMYYS